MKPQGYNNGNVSLSSNTSGKKENHCSAMGSEYLALVDAASKLGTYQLNRNAPPLPPFNNDTSSEKLFHSSGVNNVDVEDVREEAKLLWKFATSAPCEEEIDEDNSSSNHAPISPSLSFEAKRRFCSKPSSIQINNEEIDLQVPHIKTYGNQYMQGQVYSLTFPSLSLNDASQSTACLSTEENISTPGELFSQSITTEKNSNVKLPAETIANNIMQSFLKALDWRGKVWAKSLSNYLHCEYDSKKEDAINVGSRQAEVISSNEARVLEAIVHAASSVVVHDIRTTFQVLEEQLDRTSSLTNLNTGRVIYGRPPPKKRKTNRCHENPYKLSHAIDLETRCTISTKCRNSAEGLKHMTVILQSSGVINGTFYRSHGGVKLVNVEVVLDTRELALSMEKNSRLVIRTAAHNYILNPPKPEHQDSLMIPNLRELISDDSSAATESETEYVEEEYIEASYSHIYPSTDSTDTPATPYRADQYTSYSEATMVTPMKHISRSSSESEDMPPPAPRLPLDDDRADLIEKVGCKLHPRRVSPTVGVSSTHNDGIPHKSSDPFASPIPSKSIKKLTLGDFEQSSNMFSPLTAAPYLISPHTPGDDRGINERFLSPRVAPSLPALLEVARAAHAHCI